MDLFYRIVSLLGGLALFLYGMRVMGDGLKSGSGTAMKAALAKVTDRPFKGFILGLIVTCMIQSSTAAIVLTVGLVGAGFLTFRQSIGIVLGANVGTTITAQIIRLMDVKAASGSILYFFKSDNLAPMALIAGIIMIMFVNKRSAKTAGTILMGFGILFVGLMNMSASVAKMGAGLSHMLVSFEGNPALGFGAGVLVTGIIQSSSAVVGILQSIASTVGIKFCAVFPVIIGVDIGDCITTYLVCRIGAKPEQIRTALVHIMYNVVASTMLFVTVGILRATGVLDDHIWYMTLHAGGVANVHGLFKLIPALILLPSANLFGKAAEKIVKDKPEDPEDMEIKANLRKLDMRLVNNPTMALGECNKLIDNMAQVALHNYQACIQQMNNFDMKRQERIAERENMLDTMADAANQYIVAVSPHVTLETDKRAQNYQLRALVCFERIGDLSVNITDYIANLNEAGKKFTPYAEKELEIAMEAVHTILDMGAKASRDNDPELAWDVEPLEEAIDELIESIQGRHMDRMTKGICDVFNGIQFQNILLNLERISDQCSDLAVYLLGRHNPEIVGNEHKYLHDLHHSNDEKYLERFQTYYDKYFGKLDNIQAD